MPFRPARTEDEQNALGDVLLIRPALLQSPLLGCVFCIPSNNKPEGPVNYVQKRKHRKGYTPSSTMVERIHKPVAYIVY
jgi:hypothetical protein